MKLQLVTLGLAYTEGTLLGYMYATIRKQFGDTMVTLRLHLGYTL